MSAQTRQQTLDGGAVPARHDEIPHHARRGYAVILWRAPPRTDWRQVVKWCLRAEAEGVIA